MKFLVLFVPYGKMDIHALETEALPFRHLRTNTIFPGTSEPATVAEWADASKAGEWTQIPHGYHQIIVRLE